MMVPPAGFMIIVSGNVTGAVGADTLSKVAPHVRAVVIEIRPAGAQSPVNPLNT